MYLLTVRRCLYGHFETGSQKMDTVLDKGEKMEILNLKHLSKRYGTPENPIFALKNISLSINEGEFLAVTGASGSGKSSLLHIIGGIDTPTEGEVFIRGRSLFDMKEKERTEFRRNNIGLIYQFFNLLPILNVRENILLPVLLGGKNNGEMEVDVLLDELGLKTGLLICRGNYQEDNSKERQSDGRL